MCVKATIERYKKATSDTSSAGTVAEINAQWTLPCIIQTGDGRDNIEILRFYIATVFKILVSSVWIRRFTRRTLIGDTMATMSHRDLKQLEGRLDKGLGKIRARKFLTFTFNLQNELLCAEIEYMQRREMELQNNNFFLREKVAETERGQQQTLNMMGAASTSNEYEQNMIHCDPRTFLQFNFMQQHPQYCSQQEDRKSFNSVGR
ncbi:MADS-box transcription factor 58 [Triticum urartu]|uniref:MADS-box transcription factor 58 n=1 Tax=Triticum urartu TaxID=4572 RepID=M7Z8D7_TRIUA|nr:MADS-box transcription factor 58 [Triticum urartu]